MIIVTNRVNSILTAAIFQAIKRIALKKPVILIYDDKEFNALQKVNYYLGVDKGDHNMITLTNKSVIDTKIFFAPFLEIDIEEEIISASGRAITYKTGKLKFNNSDEDKNLKNILDMYNINELIYKKTSNTLINRNVKKKKSSI